MINDLIKKTAMIGIVIACIAIVVLVPNIPYMPWMQYFPGTSVYALAIAFATLLTLSYFDYNNPNISDSARVLNSKKLTAVGLVGAFAIVLGVATPWIPFSFTIYLAPAAIVAAPCISFYYDYRKKQLTKNKRKLISPVSIAMISIAIMTLLAFLLESIIWMVSFYVLDLVFALVTVIVTPIVSLYFDYKNSLPARRSTKLYIIRTVITIAVGSLALGGMIINVLEMLSHL